MLQLRLQLIAALALWALSTATQALAHGNPPAGGLVAFDPTDSDHIWLRTSFGIITSADGGASWRWLCAEGMGYDANVTDPPLALFGGGAVTLGLSDGLSVSLDGCDFSPSPALTGHVVVDLVALPTPLSAVALSTDALGVDDYQVRLGRPTTARRAGRASAPPRRAISWRCRSACRQSIRSASIWPGATAWARTGRWSIARTTVARAGRATRCPRPKSAWPTRPSPIPMTPTRCMSACTRPTATSACSAPATAARPSSR